MKDNSLELLLDTINGLDSLIQYAEKYEQNIPWRTVKRECNVIKRKLLKFMKESREKTTST